MALSAASGAQNRRRSEADILSLAVIGQTFQFSQSVVDKIAGLPRDRCVADNQNGLGNRPDHERASYPRFVLVDETECGDWVVVFVANPELRKASFGYIRLNWFKSVSHFSDPLPLIWLPQLHSTRWTGAVGQDGLKTFSGDFPDKLVVSLLANGMSAATELVSDKPIQFGDDEPRLQITERQSDLHLLR